MACASASLTRPDAPGIGRPHRLTAIPSSHRLRRPPPVCRESSYARVLPAIVKVMGAVCTPRKRLHNIDTPRIGTAHFAREDLPQRFLLCRRRLLIVHTRPPVQSPSRILPGPVEGDHEDRRTVVKVGLAIYTVRNMESERGIAAPTRGGAWTRHGQIRSQLHASKYSPVRCHGSCAIQLSRFPSNKVMTGTHAYGCIRQRDQPLPAYSTRSSTATNGLPSTQALQISLATELLMNGWP